MSKKRSPPQDAPHPQPASRGLTDVLICAVMNGPATVMITNLDGAIEYVNRTFCSLTGYALAEVFGQQASMMRSGLMPEQTYLDLWAQLRSGENWTGELQGRKKNGECYWEQASISPIRDDTGAVCHFLKIAEDITQRKLLENELLTSIETLRMSEANLQNTCGQLAAAARALKKSQRKLQRLSQEDALTGLLNRRGFKNELRRVKALAEREGHCIGFLIIDIDRFKEINDVYGHAIGDHILKTFADLLRAHLRASDLICRYGGDEIVIALPATDPEATRLTAKRILKAVRQHDFSKGKVKLTITVSIGAACKTPVTRQSLDKVLKLTDRALYCIKKKGRNGMAFWASDEDLAASSTELDAAAESEHSQPFRLVFHMLVAMLDAREKATGDHSKRVAKMACELARAMNLQPAQVELVKQGALLHDIGKVAIPDTILLKPGPLTPAERKIVQKHPKTGYDILQSCPEFKAISEIVLSHQERFDGSGYPHGLKGKKICLGARVFAVVDAYDAIRAGRPYAKPRSEEEALLEIQKHRGKQFDPEVVDALARCQSKIEAVLKGRTLTCSGEPAPRGQAPSARTRRS